jgi:hypothetical protein
MLGSDARGYRPASGGRDGPIGRTGQRGRLLHDPLDGRWTPRTATVIA